MSFLIRPDSFFQLNDSVADTSVTRWAAKLLGHKAKTFFSYGITKQMIHQDKSAIGPTIFYRNYTSYVAGRITGEELVVKTAQLLDVPSDKIDLQSVIHAAICVGRVIGYSAFSMIPYMATHPTVVSLLAACGVRFLLAAMSEIEGEDYKLYPGFPIQLIDRSVKDVTCTVFLVAVENGYVRPRVPVREVSKAQRDNAVIVAHGVFRNELIRRTAALRSEGFVLSPVQQDMETLVATRLADFLNKTDDISCFFNRIEKEEYFDKTMYSIATVTDGKWTIDYIPMYFDEFIMKGYVEWPRVPEESGFVPVSDMVNETRVAGSSMLTNVESRSIPNTELVNGVIDFYKTKSGYVVEKRTDDMAVDLAVTVARSVCKCGDVDKNLPDVPSSASVSSEIVSSEVITSAPLRMYHDTKHETECGNDTSRDSSQAVATPIVRSQRSPPLAATSIECTFAETPIVESQTRSRSSSAPDATEYTLTPVVPSQELRHYERLTPDKSGGNFSIAESSPTVNTSSPPDFKAALGMWKRTLPRTDDEVLKNMSLKELRMLAGEFVAYDTADVDQCDPRLIFYCGMNVPATAQLVCWICTSPESGTFTPAAEASCKYASPGFRFCGRLFLLKKGLTGDPLLKRRSGVKFVMHKFINERLGYEYVPHALTCESVHDVEVYVPRGTVGVSCGCTDRKTTICRVGVGGRTRPTVVSIITRYSSAYRRERTVYGRGFVVGTLVVTAAHVVMDSTSVRIASTICDQFSVEAYIIGVSVEKDIAVLAAFPGKSAMGRLSMCADVVLPEGEHKNLQSSVLYANDKPMNVIEYDQICLLLSTTLDYGYSGTPLTDSDDRLIAMYVGTLVNFVDGNRVGLAVRISQSLLRDVCQFI